MKPGKASGSTSVDEARNALGKRLRELRRQAGQTGKQLAESLSWPASKVSKIENGRQTPTDDDIRGWTRSTNGEGETEALLASLHTLEVQHAEWRRILRVGMLSHQLELSEQDQKTRLYRSFEPAVIPGLLQTPECARAIFSQVVMVHKVPNDLDDAVAKRMQRQEMLYVPSGLVMQRFDGIDPACLWQINAQTDRPGLTVILEADPEVISRHARPPLTEECAASRLDYDELWGVQSVELRLF